MRAEVEVPKFFKKSQFTMTAVKHYTPNSQLVATKIVEQYPRIHENPRSSHFVEIQDKITADQGTYHFTDQGVETLNKAFHSFNHKQSSQKIAILNLGNAAPGANNIVDGLLKF